MRRLRLLSLIRLVYLAPRYPSIIAPEPITVYSQSSHKWVKVKDFEALKGENDRICYDAGREDGEAGKPYNKYRANGCIEFGGISDGYEEGYQFGCETHTTEASCELKYEDKKYYCPNHPDIVGCVDFLHNATNKKPESTGVCAVLGIPVQNPYASKNRMPKNTVQDMTTQHFVEQLEIFVMKMVL